MRFEEKKKYGEIDFSLTNRSNRMCHRYGLRSFYLQFLTHNCNLRII